MPRRLVPPIQHGTARGYFRLCRCEPCRQAYRVYKRAQMLRLRVHGPLPKRVRPEHGTTAYNHGCRCDVCTAAASDRVQDWQRRAGIMPPKPVKRPRRGTAKERLAQRPASE